MVKRLKIIFFITEDWYFYSHRLSIARAARDIGFQVVVVTHVQDYQDKIIKEGFKLIPIRLRRKNRNPLKEFLSIVELVAIFKREQPNIVHQVSMKPILYGTLAARIAKVPVIINALSGLGYTFISNQWGTKILRFFINFIFKFVLNVKNGKIIIQNSDDLALLVLSGIVKRQNVVLIRGVGVDTSKFVFIPECNGKPVVVLASRMLWDKGVREFVDAAKLLLKEGIDGRFILIGDSDYSNPSFIPVSVLKEWQNEGFVEWWGHRDDISDIFSKCHIVCLPSYREGLPKVLIEAASCGRAIVATDTAGCKEIVRDNDNGLLVPIRNAEALAIAIRKLITNPLLRKKMGLRGREIAMSEFSEEIAIEKTLAVYREFINF